MPCNTGKCPTTSKGSSSKYQTNKKPNGKAKQKKVCKGGSCYYVDVTDSDSESEHSTDCSCSECYSESESESDSGSEVSSSDSDRGARKKSSKSKKSAPKKHAKKPARKSQGRR